MTTKKRCAIYTRKSTTENLDNDVNSLRVQRQICTEAAQRQGWSVLDEIYDDGGRTGANVRRPAFQRLIRDAVDKKFDVIVVYKMDRLSRSLRDFVNMHSLFDKLGVELFCATQAIPTTGPAGALSAQVLMAVAEFERSLISTRVRDSIAEARRAGKWTGCTPPYGYRVQNRVLVPDEDTSKVVQFIFDTYEREHSCIRVLRGLRENGYAPRVKAWTVSVGVDPICRTVS